MVSSNIQLELTMLLLVSGLCLPFFQMVSVCRGPITSCRANLIKYVTVIQPILLLTFRFLSKTNLIYCRGLENTMNAFPSHKTCTHYKLLTGWYEKNDFRPEHAWSIIVICEQSSSSLPLYTIAVSQCVITSLTSVE